MALPAFSEDLNPQPFPQPLQEALALMAANLEEPLPADELATLSGVSRRQLERLFAHHIGVAPTRHYLTLRLEHARSLLLHTSDSIIQVGLSCGFCSGAHFSTAYRAQFGSTPRDERQRKLGAA